MRHQEENTIREIIANMIANFEQSPITTKRLNLPPLSKYRKILFHKYDCPILDNKNTADDGYSTFVTPDISSCKKSTIPIVADFDDELFEKDFDIKSFINIPTDEKHFTACYGKLSYVINHYLQNNFHSVKPDPRSTAEKNLLAIYFIFVALYATDNILYPLNVLLQLYFFDFEHLKNQSLTKKQIDNCEQLIKELEPLLTWENISQFLDTADTQKDIKEKIEEAKTKYKSLKKKLDEYCNDWIAPKEQIRQTELDVLKEKILLRIHKYDKLHLCNIQSTIYRKLCFYKYDNPLGISVIEDLNNDLIAFDFSYALKIEKITEENFNPAYCASLLREIMHYHMYSSHDNYTLSYEQKVYLEYACFKENKYFISLLLKKYESCLKEIQDHATVQDALKDISPKEFKKFCKKQMNHHLANILDYSLQRYPNRYNSFSTLVDKPQLTTAPFRKHSYKKVLQFFGTYNIPFSISKLKRKINKGSPVFFADAPDFEEDTKKENKNKFFNNKKIYIITFLRYAISRYISEGLQPISEKEQHWNRCLLFFHGCIIIKLLHNHYCGDGQLGCFTQIHSKLSYFLLKELQYINPNSIEIFKPYLELGNMAHQTNYKSETKRIINNLTAFAHGYVTCRCPYFEEHYNQTGQLYPNTNYCNIKKECGKSCYPCIFNHRLWPSSCEKLDPNQFRFIFKLPVTRRNLQNYFNPSSNKLSNPVQMLRALEENTGIPSFCIDGIFPTSNNPTPNSNTLRYAHKTFSDTRYTYCPHEEWSIPIYEREVLNLYLKTIYEKEQLSIDNLIMRFKSTTYFDEDGHACIDYIKFFEIHYPPVNHYLPLSDVSLFPKIPPWNYQINKLLPSEQVTITEDKFLHSCLCETEYAPFPKSEIAFDANIPLLSYEDSFSNLKPIYCKDKVFVQLKSQLKRQYENLGKTNFLTTIKDYNQEMTKEGFDVVIKDFAFGIINDEYDFCFIRIFDALCDIFDIKIPTNC